MDAAIGEKYIGRWRQRLDLRFRVWPVGDDAHRLTWRKKEIPVHGFLMNQWGKLEAIYRNWMDKDSVDPVKRYRSFEINDDDAEILAAIPLAGAEADIGHLVIQAPGTLDSKAKQISWLRIPVNVNLKGGFRTRSAECWRDESAPLMRCYKGADLGGFVKECGIAFGKIVHFRSSDEVDEDAILRAVLEEDAVIAFAPCIPMKVITPILKRAKYWVVDGRKPEEPGGILKGYQFSDRFFRWFRRSEEPYDPAAHMSKMHAVVREKGAATRRKYFVDQVVNRFAEQIGVSRQRVTAQLLDDGIIDWLVRSVDVIKVVPARETSTLLRARIKDAVRAIEFLYRAQENPLIGPTPEKPRKTKGRPFTATRVDLPSEGGQGVEA